MPDRWLAEFDCEDCGQFSDFAGARLVPEHRRSPQVPLPHESAGAKSHDDERDEDEFGGNPA